MDIEELRKALSDRRGEWSRIAAEAGVTRRTIYRIVNAKNMPNMQTVIDLARAVRERERSRQAA